MYQAALDRLAREFAAIEKIDEETATARLEKLMNVDKITEQTVETEDEDDFEEELE